MASEELFGHEFENDLGLEQQLDDVDDGEGREMHEDTEMCLDDIVYENDRTASLEPANSNDPPFAIPQTNEKEESKVTTEHEPDAKLIQLPLARIRNIMKLDPDLQVASNEAVFAVTKSVELFIASLARESYTYTVQAKKKTIQKRDVDLAISAVDSLMFLDGAMSF